MMPLAVAHGARSALIPMLAALLGIIIFLVDTLTPLDMAVAVLYVAVVMLLADVLTRRGILAVGALCIGLTTISFFAVHNVRFELEAVARAIVALSAIGIVTLLSLRNRHSSESLRDQAALLDLTHDAILVRDASDTLLYWNRGAEELYGWTADEAVGRNTAELLRTGFPISREAAAVELERHGRWEGELRHTRKDGARVTVASRWSLRRDAQGRPLAVMETNNDITERKASQDRLDKAQAELVHVTHMATLGQLTASIAHEVNQPLAAVVTNGEACLRWLRRPSPDVGEALASVERMIANGRRAGEVVARMRALSRRQADRQETVDLSQLVRESLALVERELTRHHIAVELDLADALPVVTGDRVQLQQIVINLAVNAVQAMEGAPRPRRLKLRTRALEWAEGEAARLDITDSGVGADTEAMSRLFEPFYTSKPDAMGLGLSISRYLVEAHGGVIEATLNSDRGMTFAVILPAAKEQSL
ncbi:two-component system sensor histidine kinase NtrB [Ancylobacter radicis]|uniref:histidine kinase n=1 Tax=Ancylobacter radicis TaxID=2836179 RepID=A0ABS5R5S2_9HYPH|nr:ATP-binding protein [Ancylobacter radicis]MBS9476998.1 PAS domain S-box protein [Ancylobacter radicis]